MRLYGQDGFPLYLADDSFTADFDLTLSPENIITTRDKVNDFMSRNHVPSTTAARVMLIIEELGMLIREKNPDSKILAEFTVMINPGTSVEIIERDNGIIFDITNEDARIESLRSFVVSNIMTSQRDKKNLLTTSLNRNVLMVEY